MNKKLGLISSILKGTKTIESRWYVNKVAPWSRITTGETIYFKDSGEPITAKAIVEKVIQIDNLDNDRFDDLMKKYADAIEISKSKRIYNEYYQKKRYVILIFLKNPGKVSPPMNIDKKGFGNACAWLCVPDITKIAR